jgi:hypothetical protein
VGGLFSGEGGSWLDLILMFFLQVECRSSPRLPCRGPGLRTVTDHKQLIGRFDWQAHVNFLFSYAFAAFSFVRRRNVLSSGFCFFIFPVRVVVSVASFFAGLGDGRGLLGT